MKIVKFKELRCRCGGEAKYQKYYGWWNILIIGEDNDLYCESCKYFYLVGEKKVKVKMEEKEDGKTGEGDTTISNRDQQ